MATYLVNAPNRSSVGVSCKLGSFNFRHQQVMYDDKLAQLFPSIFTKISDDSPTIDILPAVEPAPVVEEQKPFVPEPVVEATPVVEEVPEPVVEESVPVQEEVEEIPQEEENAPVQEEETAQQEVVEEQQSYSKRGRKAKRN
jgi:hypothetical protein